MTSHRCAGASVSPVTDDVIECRLYAHENQLSPTRKANATDLYVLHSHCYAVGRYINYFRIIGGGGIAGRAMAHPKFWLAGLQCFFPPSNCPADSLVVAVKLVFKKTKRTYFINNGLLWIL